MTQTLILADEYAQLQYKEGDQVFATARKFNVRLRACLQDYAQLKELHPKTSETFMNNAGVVIWMAASDLAGSEYLSKMLGVREERGWGRSIGWNLDGKNWNLHVTDCFQHTTVPLVRPEQIRGMRTDAQIIFLKGVRRPVLAVRKPYHETPLRKFARPNPYYPTKPSKWFSWR